MADVRAERPGEPDRVVLLAGGDGVLKRAVRERLSRPARRGGMPGAGGRLRAKVLLVDGAAEARRRVTAAVDAAAIDLSIRGASGLDVIRELRDRRPDLAILAFSRRASTSDAIAAMMAGADFFHDCGDGSCDGFLRALGLAIDHRELTRLIERNEEETEAARRKLAQLSGDIVRAVPGFRPLHAAEDVLPFREAARRYLLAAAQLFEGDARGLAAALGLSYFALRRLLARYEVPFPAARSRR
jgi:ActR/RegA family two-component response regulator